MRMLRRSIAATLSAWLLGIVAAAGQDRPNILIIWGDDIGRSTSAPTAQTYVANLLSIFRDYPPPQEAASFSLDRVMDMLVPPTH